MQRRENVGKGDQGVEMEAKRKGVRKKQKANSKETVGGGGAMATGNGGVKKKWRKKTRKEWEGGTAKRCGKSARGSKGN
jgi:hypothetical protein